MKNDKSPVTINEVSKDALQFAYELGQKSSQQAQVQKYFDDASTPYAIVPTANGLEVVNLSKTLKLERPERKRAKLEFFDVQSFIDYVNEHKGASTRIFVQNQEAPYTYTAIIDYHEAGFEGKADWQTHSAKLILKTSTEFDVWCARNTKGFGQMEFVDFLKDRRMDIIQPTGAELLEIAMTLEATTGSRVTSKARTNSGIHLEFKEDISAHAGKDGSLNIPESIILQIPVFQGMQQEHIEADFIFRVNSGTLVIAYRMIGIDNMIQAAVRRAQDNIHEKTNLPCYIGKIC